MIEIPLIDRPISATIYQMHTLLEKKEWGGHTWTQDELKQLFAGKEVSIEGLTSSNDNATGKKNYQME